MTTARHIDRMRRAIEFGSPDCVPMELVDVPHLYDAYGTLDPATVTIPGGAESFDSAWCTQHWVLEDIGCNGDGERLRRDEWGCTHVVPHNQDVAYTVIAKPELATLGEFAAHPWPDPDRADPLFERRKQVIEQHYPDRFICGFLDGGPFLWAFNLLGYEGLLMQLHDNLDMVKAVLRKVFDYQIALVPKFAAIGTHMVNVIDEIAGGAGMMFSPSVWRVHFKPMYDELFGAIHAHNMYTSLLYDGDIGVILPDLMAMELDQMFFAQPHATGLDVIADHCRGKRCVKLAVDMMETLPSGTPAAIEAEVDSFVEKFRTDRGGLVFQAMRWHRPAYDSIRVKAQLDAMNKYRIT